jgi:hypothetical protein
MWDAEVDLVCVGAGIGGLATAIATIEEGGDVIVADTSPDPGHGDAYSVATRRRVGSLRAWLQHDVLDIDTDDYLAAVVEGLVPLAQRVDTDHVPTRLASVWRGDERTVEPFFGTAVRAWDAKCLASPHGMLYTTISGRPTTKMRSSNGELIEVLPVGEIDRSVDVSQLDLADWMVAQARERDVEVLSSSLLQRLVFEDGLIVGVVFDRPDGPFAVRARHGVTLSQRDYQPALVDRLIDPAPADRRHVCVVGRTASRFGRVEMVTTTAAPAVDRPVCATPGRQLRARLHESSRQVPSDAWRCGKVDGYPPLHK